MSDWFHEQLQALHNHAVAARFDTPQSRRAAARLRVTVTAAHEEAQILSLCEALARQR